MNVPPIVGRLRIVVARYARVNNVLNRVPFFFQPLPPLSVAINKHLRRISQHLNLSLIHCDFNKVEKVIALALPSQDEV
jgi:hypothetical protein